MKLDELSVGMEYHLSKTFNEEEVLTFSKLSLDNNPLHVDKEYADASIFKAPIVHGFLTGSLISAIIGTKMPGNGSIYLKQTMNFRKPVYINQIITAHVKISDINFEKSLVTLDTFCTNNDDEIVIEGMALVKLLNI